VDTHNKYLHFVDFLHITIACTLLKTQTNTHKTTNFISFYDMKKVCIYTTKKLAHEYLGRR